MSGEAEGKPWPTWPDGFVLTDGDRRALLVLSALRTITPRRLIALAAERATAAVAPRTSEADAPGATATGGSPARWIRTHLPPERRRRAPGSRRGVRPEYPSQLEQIHDPPAALYVIGAPLPDVTRAAAIVGAAGARRSWSRPPTSAARLPSPA